jgi:hypothetical protein
MEIGGIMVIWVEVDIQVLKELALEEGAGRGDGERGKGVRCGDSRVLSV